MRNAGLEEAQAGIKIAERNINNLRYADDIPLMAESEEELKSLLMKVKERKKQDGRIVELLDETQKRDLLRRRWKMAKGNFLPKMILSLP